MTFNELIEKIDSGFREHSIVVWCGAGISIPSGLPGAVQLVKELLENTSLTPEERNRIQQIVPGRLPFERLMEVVLDTMDKTAQTGLLKLFTLGEPNAYHLFLAHLAKSGMLKTIFTTNFDCHIETALQKAELKQGKDYEVWHDPDTFGEIDWKDDVLRLIKLHGSVEATDKLAVTVKRVAAPGAVQQMLGPVNHVFGDGDHSVVLALGYSFSDRFDLSPAIKKLGEAGSSKFIVDLQYTSPEDQKFKINRVKSNDSSSEIKGSHPLTAFTNSWRLSGDTVKVIARLCERLELKNIRSSSPLPDCSSFLRNFFTDLDHRHNGIAGYHLAGELLAMISADRNAVPYFEHVVSLAEKTNNVRLQLVARQSLAGALIRIGEIDYAHATLKQAETLTTKFEDGKFSDHVFSQLGSLYNQLGASCFQQALKYYNSAFEVAKKDRNFIRCVPHLAGIAECWMKLGDFDAAQEAYAHTLGIVAESGDLYRKAEAYGNIASMAYILRDYDSALKWYEEALKTSSLAGDTERVGIHTMNLANVYVKLKRYKDALSNFAKARELLKGIWTDHPILQLLDKHEQQAKRWSSGGKQEKGKEKDTR